MESLSFKGIAEVNLWQNQNGKENSVQFVLGQNLTVLVSNSIVRSVIAKTTGTIVPVSALIMARKANIDIQYAAHKAGETWKNEKTGVTGTYASDGHHVVKLVSIELPQKTLDRILEHELRANYIPTNASVDIDDVKPF